MVDAYEYAELGEAAGLVNMTDEAPEGAGMDSQRQRLLQRSRVLESCVSELEARRAAEPKTLKTGRQILTGPQVAEHMSTDIRSVDQTMRPSGRRAAHAAMENRLAARDRYAHLCGIPHGFHAGARRRGERCGPSERLSLHAVCGRRSSPLRGTGRLSRRYV